MSSAPPGDPRQSHIRGGLVRNHLIPAGGLPPLCWGLPRDPEAGIPVAGIAVLSPGAPGDVLSASAGRGRGCRGVPEGWGWVWGWIWGWVSPVGVHGGLGGVGRGAQWGQGWGSGGCRGVGGLGVLGGTEGAVGPGSRWGTRVQGDGEERAPDISPGRGVRGDLSRGVSPGGGRGRGAVGRSSFAQF